MHDKICQKLKLFYLKSQFHFRCPLCRYDAKHFLNLSSHFFSKHDVLQEWIRESLEELTEQRMKETEEAMGKGDQMATEKREVEEEADTV